MPSTPPLDPRSLYRLPWSAADNIISWLEPTKVCNIYCEGCYSMNKAASHKSLDQVEADLDVFARLRNTDCVSIAGGDPLTHPDVVEIVRRVAARGYKPIVNTNGFAMTPELLRELKAAGLKGLTFHVDSGQKRRGWEGKTEAELNVLRQRFADMVAAEGGMSCAFNSTIYEHTLKDVPTLLAWGQRNIDKVHVMVFILFRAAVTDGSFDHYVGGRKVDMGKLVYGRDVEGRTDLRAPEVVATIRRDSPRFDPCAFLNGTEQPDSFKWLMTLRFGVADEILGCAGKKFVEAAQVLNHLFFGKYLGYVPPRTHARGKWMLPLAVFDRGIRGLLKNWLKRVARNPLRVFLPFHMQSVMIIQPVDILPDGRMSMCDGCPDMTVHGDEIVWSCRLEEKLNYGEWVRMVPARKEPAPR